MLFLYNIGIWFYGRLIRLAAPFKKKARQWREGRVDWEHVLSQKVNLQEPWIWFHCASLGEFEQGRSLLEQIRKEYPDYRVLLTFFSPSGYEVRKAYPQADCVSYLPLDSPGNARKFLDIVQPRMAFFVKYELWLNYLRELRKRRVPAYLVSTNILPGSRFLRWPMRRTYRKALRGFKGIFAQTQKSADTIQKFIKRTKVHVSGDTRFDRVGQIYDQMEEIPEIAEWVGDRFCIVAGSTWPKDEQLLLQLYEKTRTMDIKWIFAPHEINLGRIRRIIEDHPGEMIDWENRDKLAPQHRVLWIDTIGILNKVYRYASVAWIGGGFDKGIHNSLEAAVFGAPVFFGPKYKKFAEAEHMVALGTAFPVRHPLKMERELRTMLLDDDYLAGLRQLNLEYTHQSRGATEAIMDKIRPALEERLQPELA